MKGLPYFLVALPLYAVRLRRMRRCKRLARAGRPAIGVVDWTQKAPSPARRATLKVGGVSLLNVGRADAVNWVPYRYHVDGREFVAVGPDGYGPFRYGEAVVAARLPTGMTVHIVYDPHRPQDSHLLGYLRHYLDIPAESSDDNDDDHDEPAFGAARRASA